ncbi:NAD(P)/FAD-dependent oxidoreductase [Salinarimonas soli]|uniref:TIGR03862 family flavoprotein n=1 Tax=Salinarimonas soli TaxID=1638099 RepID=A0A5B2V2R2_9HYPH|nr:TIGR03862 family flavoprotein [Salinarimonas soli]KAA2233131.1 TIGR03862 family flavoprotein [Salinarimonas soli]
MTDTSDIAVIGGGPAGLIAAETLAQAGRSVTVYDRMPSVGRKLLMAGRGGLNITHSEEIERFMPRYGAAEARLRAAIDAFPPGALRAWTEELGQETFVGTSGRVFPRSLKASPLLRAWLRRLDAAGVRIRARHAWEGWSPTGDLVFTHPEGTTVARPAATVLALGGASWPRLGSDGAWVRHLQGADVLVQPLLPSNCGVLVAWSEVFRGRFEGEPLKRIALSFGGRTVRGEAVVTRGGLEGGAVYALSGPLRDAVARDGAATLKVDLRPDLAQDDLARRLGRPRAGQSASTFLRKAAALSPAGIGLLREGTGGTLPAGADELACLIKAVPLRVEGVQAIERAISSAGGVPFEETDERFMLRRRPGVFVAGEMLDWEAPTGGYLLQATFATGLAAARGALAWLDERATSCGDVSSAGAREPRRNPH